MGRGGQTTMSHLGPLWDCSQASSSGAWFCRDPAFPEQLSTGKAVEVLEQVRRSLQERPRDWRDCVRWARQHWQSCYHDAVAQLLHTFPPEHVSTVPMGLAPPASPALRWLPCCSIPGPDFALPVPGSEAGCPLLGMG